MFYDGMWPRYVPVAERRAKAAKQMEKLRKKGHPVSPVVVEGRAIARTFWGKAWCDNLERYSDFENRLPRGRTYVRNGSVVDLQIGPGEVTALVSGSAMYKVVVKITPVSKGRWQTICSDCAGGIDSLVELLQGRFSKGVMERLCQQGSGLFPSPKEIKLSCSCPDWAEMCKHVAAVLYGVGARLDEKPELLFRLHKVDANELLARVSADLELGVKAPAPEKALVADDLSAIFGVDLAEAVSAAADAPAAVTVAAPAPVPAVAGVPRGASRTVAAKASSGSGNKAKPTKRAKARPKKRVPKA